MPNPDLDAASRRSQQRLIDAEIERQKAGGLYGGASRAGRVDPIYGTNQVIAPNGQVTRSTPLTSAAVGEGASVQVTVGTGGTTHHDYRPPKGGQSDGTSAGDIASRGGLGTNGFNPAGSGGGTSNRQPVYQPGPNGCTPLYLADGASKPNNTYASLDECLEATKPGKRYRCQAGRCVEDPNGRYSSLGECVAALIPADFTGGQCPTLYTVSWRVTANSVFNPRWDFTGTTQVFGPIEGIVTDSTPRAPGFNTPASNDLTYYVKASVTIAFPDGKYPLPLGIAGVISGTETITGVVRIDNQPDNCGNPPRRCPG